MRTLFWTILSLGLCGCFASARADTYSLTDGSSISGDIILFNDAGVTFRTPSDNYTNVVWPKFSQDALMQLSKNPKIKPYAELFIEAPPTQPKTEKISIHDVPRLQLPAKESLLAALLSSSVGFVVLLILYAANVYAAYEIAIVRSRPIGMVMGVAAVLPILGPIIFLSMPVRVQTEQVEEQPRAEPQSFSVPGAAAAPTAENVAAGVHITPAAGSKPAPEAQIFQRGQFMFNRRFFETKFSGFFSVIRRPAEKDLVLVVKTACATLVAQRITRIATNEAHFEVLQGAARQEVMVPFADIQEIQLKHKDA
ncbi:MAG TPA: hypothetical protein VMA13_10480 [Candidatus Saccharimonadales bacterium]|nr:hypothetical protein [Candidatus Saccharimonadales bacterium]